MTITQFFLFYQNCEISHYKVRIAGYKLTILTFSTIACLYCTNYFFFPLPILICFNFDFLTRNYDFESYKVRITRHNCKFISRNSEKEVTIARRKLAIARESQNREKSQLSFFYSVVETSFHAEQHATIELHLLCETQIFL